MEVERNTVLVRADMINDLKRLDEELSKHLSRVWMMKHNVHNNNNGVETKVRIRVLEKIGRLMGFLNNSVQGKQRLTREEKGLSIFEKEQGIAVSPSMGRAFSVNSGFADSIEQQSQLLLNIPIYAPVPTVFEQLPQLGPKTVVVFRAGKFKVLDLGEDDQMKNSKTASRRRAFMQEVSVWHKLDHPNIAKMVGATRNSQELDNCENLVPNKNASCILVEYLPGLTLKNYLVKSRRKKLAFNTVMQLALDIARGVEASNASDMTGQTGTLGYMAPENLRPEIPRCCPRELANVMKKCWDRDPKKRPEMRDVVGMLEAIHVSKGRGMVPLDRQSRGFFCCFRP
ncbi:protein kinase superfamily protein [Actinidia rufa]|uniref:Protein kinase superfamily protein n=1 Tax=Actinidia rufa TaxID=165716 RepID=A0A7J0EZJ6_9ERIC|nr:protein kinase superfamily protein [Actinidia rufa]